MNRAVLLLAVTLLCLSYAAHADVFNLGNGYTNLETVAVGDSGNSGEVSGSVLTGTGRVCGSVGYDYRIGKYEVTAKQYADFLNHKAKCGDPYQLYNTFMADIATFHGCNIQRSGGGTVADPYVYSVPDDWANRPVNWVSFADSCRFANWLNNGQGNGSTETGAYDMGQFSSPYLEEVTRNAGWKWAVTSEDEWYKAAHYKGGGTNAGYWDYPTGSDTAPGRDMADASGNNANYFGFGNTYLIGSPYYRTNVGEFQNSVSAYGTYDQGGNVWEWNEAILGAGSDFASFGQRGSAYIMSTDEMKASFRYYSQSGFGYEEDGIGFRVVTIPEPSSLVALFGGLVSIVGLRRRRS